MAKKSESDSIMDMFASLGRDLRLPGMDVDRILEHHRKNLEAFEKSARTASSGAASMMEKQREILQDTLREINEMAESYRTPGSPQDLMNKQTDFAKRSFETAVKNTGEMADLMKKSSDESLDILRNRISEGMSEIRESFENKKR